MVLESWSVNILTFLSPAYEGCGHLHSLVAFPSSKYTQDVLISSRVDSEATFLEVKNFSPRSNLNTRPQDP